MRPTPSSSTNRADTRGEVRFDNVSFRYPVVEGQLGATTRWSPRSPRGAQCPAGVMPFALSDISYTAGAGSARGAGGAVGQRQDDIAYLIPRLYDVDDGAVLIDGMDVRGVKLASLGRGLGS